MKKCLLCHSCLTLILLNHPLTMAISSEKTNKSAAVNKAKKLPFLGRKIKRKTADLPELLSESDILGGEDKLSVSMILAEVKERTGDLSQMVRLSFAYSWCESLLDQFSFVKDESVVEVHSNSYIQIRGGARNTHLSFSQRPFLRNPGSQPGMEQESSWLDRLAKKFCFYAVVAVFIQSLSTILSNNDLDEIADRFLSKESALAVKTIQQIIDNFPHHGVIDIFSLYPTREVLASIIALSRLQRAALYGAAQLDQSASTSGGAIDFLSAALSLPSNAYDTDKGDNREGSECSVANERELLCDLAHYSAYAHAAYGWKFGLLSGSVHLGDRAMLLRKTGVKRHDIIHSNWKSKTHLPAHFLLRDVKRKTIVLCIRGTLSPKDLLTDLCCTAEDFVSHEEEMRELADENDADLFRKHFRTKHRARAHHGMLESARGVAGMTRKLIASELASKPDYNLIIVGHSLGGGVAAILATLWGETFPNLKVYAYGCPCVGPINFEPAMSNSIVSVVGEGDPFSCLSLGHLADASVALSRLCEDKDLRESILNHTKAELGALDEIELRWCIRTMSALQRDMKVEKFYPPGRVLYMKGDLFGSIDEVTLYEVDQQLTFGSLRWHPRMFDLSLHIPHRYETLLSRIWEKAKRQG